MVRSLKKFNSLIIIGFFILLYQPPLLMFNTMHIVGLVSLVYFSLKLSTNVITNATARISVHYFSIFLWLLITVSLNGQSLLHATYPLYFIIDIIPFACAIVIFCNDKNVDLHDLLNLFLFVALIQAVLGLVAFAIPSVQRTFINTLINYGFEETILELASYRMYGFSSGLTFATPIIQAVAAIISLTNKSLKIIIKIPLFIVLAISAIINARVSFIVLIVGTIIYILFSENRISTILKYLVDIVIIMASFFYIIFPYLLKEYPTTYLWLRDGINDIFSLLGGDQVSYSYFEYISDKKHFDLPSSIMALFFGKGSTIMGTKFGVSSDVGYINDIWLGGIFYCAINYSLYFHMIRKIAKRGEYNKFLGVFFATLCIILNIKGSIMSSNAFTFLVVIIYLFNETYEVKKLNLFIKSGMFVL